MKEPDLFRRLREELKRAVRVLLEEQLRGRTGERLYAVLFDVDVSETYAAPIAASEESLTRYAETYVAKGYRAKSGDSLTTLRATNRWDAPGDNMIGWHTTDETEAKAVAQIIGQAVKAGLIEEYDKSQPLRRLCVEALRELDSEGTFGRGAERGDVLIGTSCVDVGFADAEEDIEELASLNPPETIARLRNELAVAAVAYESLIRPSSK